MIRVCANHDNKLIMIDEFWTIEEAQSFMKNKYVLHYADEFEDADEDEIIYPEEMFIENEI